MLMGKLIQGKTKSHWKSKNARLGVESCVSQHIEALVEASNANEIIPCNYAHLEGYWHQG